jgi:hypothetical protein
MVSPATGYSRHVRRLAVLIALAAGVALAPLPATLVESIYAARAYPVIQRAVTWFSNLVPFALFDLAAGALLTWIVFAVARVVAGHTAWARALVEVVVRVATLAAVAYLVFLVTWGFNYRRVPLKDRLHVDAARLSQGALLSLSRETVARVNALHAPAHAGGWVAPGIVDHALALAFERAQQDLGVTTLARPARPKWTVLDPYFTRAAVAGMTDPIFLETLVASDLLPFERPFVIAHEWSHLAGRADEGDANFLGWLTCLRGTASHQYSGWLFLYGEALDALDPAAQREVAVDLAAGPRADIDAIRERLLRHVSPVVQQTGWRAYDQYLKANRVERGAASYGDVLTLVLGTRVAEGWRPALR